MADTSDVTLETTSVFRFQPADFIVFIASMVVAMIIGMVSGCIGDRQGSTNEFFLAGKTMRALPAAFSLLASQLNGVFIIGGPSEIYFNGGVYGLLGVSWILMIPIVAHVFIPIYRRLESPSVFEYLGKRFSTTVRVLAAIIFTLYMFIFLGVVLYAPALAFSNVTGLPMWFSVAITGLICTKYTVVGGMRGVVWSDMYQILLVVAALLVLAIIGGQRAGGPTAVWNTVLDGGRLNLNNIDLNPYTRHTVWSQCFGQVFTWLSAYTCNQMLVQRFLATSSTHMAQRASYLAVLIGELMMLLVMITGFVMYAFYAQCDPYTSGRIQQPDQMVPLFLMEMVGHMPGMPGFFTAAVFAAALSSLSSAINSMAAVCLEDFVRPAMRALNKPVKDSAATILAKILAFVFGMATIGLSYVAPYLGPTMIAIPITIWSMVGGSLLGTFLLGVFFPCANTPGAISGLLVSLAISLWLGVGSIMYGKPVEGLPLNTTGCHVNVTQNLFSTDFNDQSFNSTILLESNPLQDFYDISYAWRSMIGTCVCLAVGLIVSVLTCGCKHASHDAALMSPIGTSCCCCCPRSCRTCLNCGHEEARYDRHKNAGSLNKSQDRSVDVDTEDRESRGGIDNDGYGHSG